MFLQCSLSIGQNYYVAFEFLGKGGFLSNVTCEKQVGKNLNIGSGIGINYLKNNYPNHLVCNNLSDDINFESHFFIPIYANLHYGGQKNRLILNYGINIIAFSRHEIETRAAIHTYEFIPITFIGTGIEHIHPKFRLRLQFYANFVEDRKVLPTIMPWGGISVVFPITH